MDKETLALIVGLASLAVGLVGVAATLLVQGHRREQKAHAEAGRVAVASDQHVGGSVVTGAGAAVVDRPTGGPTIIAQPGATVNVYVDGLAQAKPEVRDPFREGLQLQAAEQHEAAIREFEKAFVAAENDSQRCALHNLVGNSLFSLGRLREAEGHYRQALEAAGRASDPYGEAGALGNLGLVELERGDADAAEEHVRKALPITQEIGSRSLEASQLSNLGNVQFRRHHVDEAEDCYERALAIEEQIGEELDQARALGNLGVVYQKRDGYDKAEDYHRRALAIYERAGDRLGQALQMGNLGLIYMHKTELTKAWEHLLKALRLYQEIGDRLGEASMFQKLGLLAWALGLTEAAETLLREAKALYDDAGAGGEGPEKVRLALQRLAAAAPGQPAAKPTGKGRPRKKP
jgi:tetratricopeptide (TPR) repeat protein